MHNIPAVESKIAKMRLCSVFCFWPMWLALANVDEPKVFCYYNNLAMKKIGYARMAPSDIDPNLCTHLIYSYVGVTEDGNVTIVQPQTDLPDNGGKAGFRQLNALRKQNEKLKTLVLSSSWGKASANYSKIAADKSLRSKFVKNVVDFVLRHEFNGVDIHWEWPTYGGGSPDDVKNLVLLLKELRASFDKHELILGITAEAMEFHASKMYDIPGISKYVDFILLMLRFRHSAPRTGHSTPLYPSSRETSSADLTLNVDAAVHYWLDEGAPAKKLILGTSFLGRVFVLENPAEHGPGSPTITNNKSNTDTWTKSYNEICRLISQDAWTTVWDEEQRVPYSYNNNQWITYDNTRSLVEKGQYARVLGVGGVAVWGIDQDDHRGHCGWQFLFTKAFNCGLRDVGCSFVSRAEAPMPAEVTSQMMFGTASPSVHIDVATLLKLLV